MKQYYQYPSVINNGFVHIERVIEIAKEFSNADEKIIVDGGAADGVISKMFAENFPQSLIYCFEPVLTTFQQLTENTSGIKNIVRVNKALGSVPGTSVMHILDRITSSSILSVSEKIDDPYFAESLKERTTEHIQVSTLDMEIPSNKDISILKMDVQGFELEILRGSINSLKRTDIIVLEMQNHSYYKSAPLYYDLDHFLRENDFVCYDLIPSIRKNNKLMEWDSIYLSQRFLNQTGR